ncbi:uncharacterized protein TNCV_2502841 [Trichonephila clavipes]|nr:uncharacterized protein TNCV_2502841 [Trichonephila clavipes]
MDSKGSREIKFLSRRSGTFIGSQVKFQKDQLDCRPPEHHWYECSRPGDSVAHGFNRQEQAILDRFRSGHLKSMKFSEGSKSFELCNNCYSEPAAPTHILECLGLTKQDLADDPLLLLDFLRVCDVMGLV